MWIRRRLSGLLLCGVVPLALGFRLMGRPVMVLGSSMQPTLKSGQVVWMRCRHAGDPAPRQGDVVVFYRDGLVCIKRVAAAGGEVIELASFWNGSIEVMDDPVYGDPIRRFAARKPGFVQFHRIRVPDDCVYVLGDDRCSSLDSRDFGPVPLDDVLGCVSVPPVRVARGKAAPRAAAMSKQAASVGRSGHGRGKI